MEPKRMQITGSILTYFANRSVNSVADSESCEGGAISIELSQSKIHGNMADSEMTSDNDTTKFHNDLGHFSKPLSKEDRHFLVSSPTFQPTVNHIPGKHFLRKIYSGQYIRSLFLSSWYMKTLESREKVPQLWSTYSLVKYAMMCLPCFLFALETSRVSRKYHYS